MASYEEQIAAFREEVRPAGDCPYRIRTTGMLETRDGVAWTADLLRGDIKIGTVEDRGDGGAPFAYVLAGEERSAWTQFLGAAYPGEDRFSAEESLISHLTFLEDETTETV